MKLARREKLLVILVGAVVFLILVFEFLISPFLHEKRRLESGAVRKESELAEMLEMSAEYRTLQGKAKEIEKIIAGRRQGTTLFSFLEKEARRADVKGNIDSMQPSVVEGAGPHRESVVEIKLTAVTLRQLVDYIYRIESPKDVISIKRISIKEDSKSTGYLDVILQVVSLE